MAEVKVIFDEIVRLYKVEREFEQYREKVRTIILDRITEVNKAGGEKGGMCTYVTVSALRAILKRIDKI